MPVISVSLSGDLLEKLDGLVKEKGYSSRSEAIRDAVRESLSEYELRTFERGRVSATITAVCDYERRDVDERLTRLRHEHDDIVTSNLHIHIGEEYCLEIFISEGKYEQVLDFIGRIRAMRGIQQVKYTVMPIAEREH
ncbi:MAG: nickel-responsive transcriptional regulator NikR [Candidatus Geothermarchaeales archaeon]